MAAKHKIAVIIVAGGKGKRLSGDMPKQYMDIAGKPMLTRTLERFAGNNNIDYIRVVIRPEDRELFQKCVAGIDILPPVSGGKERQDSVRLGLESLMKLKPDYVLIHDAARPFVSDEMINKLIAEVKKSNAVIPAIATSDTLKKVKNSKIENTIPRAEIFTAQTPQVFDYKKILAAHKKYKGRNFPDDAAVAEADGIKVSIIAGEKQNFKITTEEDLKMAEKLISESAETRTGMGFDVHAFGEVQKNTKIKICGIDVLHNAPLVGHSDADVGLHAIVDAILGTIGAGDIGLHFPPSDKKWKGADSSKFCKHALKLLRGKNGEIVNVDVTIVCEKPKISGYRDKMQKRVAEILEIDLERVNIKATTTEKLGFLGRGEGIAAQAVVSVKIFKVRRHSAT